MDAESVVIDPDDVFACIICAHLSVLVVRIVAAHNTLLLTPAGPKRAIAYRVGDATGYSFVYFFHVNKV